jgi:hypothetical protein
LFSRVVAAGLFTSKAAQDLKSTLSGRIFSEPVHFGCFGEQVQPIEKAASLGSRLGQKLVEIPGSKVNPASNSLLRAKVDQAFVAMR